ncbi:uncharacterized protein UDID_08454 [Ustilago sp. UG-2017a]|nr:uncharacterized protein UDID_08454 [Ustilago sp. UG-2017a]
MTEEYIIKPVPPSDALAMATIQYDSFNDANNTTVNEISQLIEAEVAGSQSTLSSVPTREERIKKMMEHQRELFDRARAYTLIGIYSRSSPSPSSSASSASGRKLVGFAVWRRITSSTPPDSIETDKKEQLEPTLLNRFFAQMNRTRELTMRGKTYWFLKLLAIAPQYQRQGHGTKLLRYGLHRAQTEQVDAYLESSPMGKTTYLKAGFRILGFDRLQQKNAKRGYVEWPFMIYEQSSTQV